MWIHCLLCTQECRDENYYYNSTNFAFCQGQEHKTTTFLFFSWTFWYSPLEFNSRKIHQHLINCTKWNKCDINFEAAQIHTLSEDFVAIAVYFSRFIHQQIMAWTNKNNNDCIETNQKQLFQIRPNTAFNTIQTSYKQTFIFDRSMASRSRGTTRWQRCWAVCQWSLWLWWWQWKCLCVVLLTDVSFCSSGRISL